MTCEDLSREALEPFAKVADSGLKALDGTDVWEMLFDVIRDKAHDISEAECAKIASLLSTHTAAGAGPVGEAVAFISPESLKHLRDGQYRQATVVSYCEHGATVPLYARTVEEPGEVERLTRERDAALDEVNMMQQRINQLAYAERYADDAEARAVTAGRALETANAEKAMLVEAINDAIVTGSVAPLRAALTGDAQESGR